ncbi:hypothetical protein AB3S75_046792 [Citrus x aurantiifolia]
MAPSQNCHPKKILLYTVKRQCKISLHTMNQKDFDGNSPLTRFKLRR